MSADSSAKSPVVLIALATMTIAAYWCVGGHNFIMSDDGDYVFENIYVRAGLSWQGVRWAFTEFHASNWHPLTWISHMVDVELFGMNASRHHLVNLTIHTLNTLLLFGFLYRAAGRLWASALVAGLFALHPMHVESVAWVAERKDVLSTFFWLATMWMYVLYVGKPGWWRYLATIAFFAMGLMSKPMLVTLPAVFLLLDYWPLERFEVERCGWRLRTKGIAVGRLLMEKSPFFLMAIASSVVTVIAQRQSMQDLDSVGLSMRMTNAMASYGWYLWKMIYPVGLSVLYPYPTELPYMWAAVSLILLLPVTVLVFRYGGNFKYLPVGWLWYLVTLIPVIGIVQVGAQSHADRYTYVPYIGLFMIIAWTCTDILRLRPSLRAAAIFAAGMVLLICGVMTSQQARYWKDDVSLFGRSLRSTRNNYVLQTNLGIALASRGELDAAMRNFRESLEIEPKYLLALDAIGTLLANKGEYEEALQWHLKAAAADPAAYGPQYNIAVTLMKLGRAAEALPYCMRAIGAKPRWPEAHMQLGIVLAGTGDEAGGIAELNKAIEIKPDLWKAHVSLADIYVKQGKWDDAVRQYKRSLELRIDYDCLNNLGSALVQAGRPDEAEVFYGQAIATRPDVAGAYCNLAIVLARRGHRAEAIGLLEQALAAEPEDTQARKYLDMLTKDR